MNKPSKQELIQFIKDNNGSSYKQLSEKYNVKTSTIVSWLKSYSIKLKDYNNKPSKQELNQFIIDNNVTSYSELTSHFNATKPCIHAWLTSYSIKLSDFQEKIKKPSKDELIKFIIDNNGSSYNQLSKKYNVKTATISNWLQSYSIKLSKYSNKCKKPSKQELIQFIIDNNVSSYNQLSEKYNVANSTISRWLRLYSIKLSNYSNKRKKPSKQELIQFIIDNNVSSYDQLSEKYNVAKSTISRWLRLYSIKLSNYSNKPSKQEFIQFIKHNNGSSCKQLSEKYNVAKSTISGWLQSYSIKLSDFKNETIFYHNDNILNLSETPHENHISIKDLDYDKVVLLIKGSNPIIYVEKEDAGKTTTPNALIEEYIRKE